MSKEFCESENINIASSHLDTVTLPVLYIKKKKVMQLSLFLRIINGDFLWKEKF